ncbi:hypothetical protein [Acetobacter papayae]|nr:hypothetical protein [Acetobacter papayae]
MAAITPPWLAREQAACSLLARLAQKAGRVFVRIRVSLVPV